MIYIPKGFAHGYMTLAENTHVSYFVDNFYEPAAESGLRYDDPRLAIDWPQDVKKISTKDASLELNKMTENRQIRLFKPSVGEEELIAVNRVFQRSWLGLGPEVGEFEKEFGDYIGAPGRTLAVNSGTAALDLALRVNNSVKV